MADLLIYINNVILKFEENLTKLSSEQEVNKEILDKLKIIEPVLKSIIKGIEHRKLNIQFAENFQNLNQDSGGNIIIQKNVYPPIFLRKVILSSLFISICGIYDNIAYICWTLLHQDKVDVI